MSIPVTMQVSFPNSIIIPSQLTPGGIVYMNIAGVVTSTGALLTGQTIMGVTGSNPIITSSPSFGGNVTVNGTFTVVGSGAVNLGSGTVTASGILYAPTAFRQGAASDGSTGQFAVSAGNAFWDFLGTLSVRKITGGTATVLSSDTSGNFTFANNVTVTGTSTLTGNVTVGAGAGGSQQQLYGNQLFSYASASGTGITFTQNATATTGATIQFGNFNQSAYEPGIIVGSTLTLQTGGTLALTLDTSQNATFAAQVIVHDTLFHRSLTTMTSNNGAVTATLGTSAPTGVTVPTKWVAVNDNGTTRYSPLW